MRILLRDEVGRTVEVDTQGEPICSTVPSLLLLARDAWRAMGWPLPQATPRKYAHGMDETQLLPTIR